MMFWFLSLLFQCLDEVTFWPQPFPEWSQRSWLESRTDMVYLIVSLILWVTHTLPLHLPWKPVFNCQVRGEWQIFSSPTLQKALPTCVLLPVQPQASQRTAQVFTWFTIIRSLFPEICNVMEIQPLDIVYLIAQPTLFETRFCSSGGWNSELHFRINVCAWSSEFSISCWGGLCLCFSW